MQRGQVDTMCVVAKHRCSLLYVLSVFTLCKVTESESMCESENYTFGVSYQHHVVIVLFILLFLFFLSSFFFFFFFCYNVPVLCLLLPNPDIYNYIRKCVFVFLRLRRRRHRHRLFSKKKLRESKRKICNRWCLVPPSLLPSVQQ